MSGSMPQARTQPAAGSLPCGAAALHRVVEMLALTLWAEAGGRPVRAVEALAALAVNRARLASVDAAARLRFTPALAGAARVPPWPLLLGAVCRAPFLFGCHGPRDPRRPALLAAVSSPTQDEDAAIGMCRRVAARAAAGVLPDPTGGATHWHDAAELPSWTRGLVPTAVVAGLVFYRA
jgi:hypothetical protein